MILKIPMSLGVARLAKLNLKKTLYFMAIMHKVRNNYATLEFGKFYEKLEVSG